ncbi:ankyrin repeat-containing domain, PGG domain protein [Tanacetum coccineum]
MVPNLPCLDLLTGPREDYIKIGITLYEVSVKHDWRTAKIILDKTPELVRYSITENGDTTLHVATSASRSKQVERFVEHLVDFMSKEDLALQNKNHDTALYLAATAGNIETVKIIVEKNKDLLSIRGGGGQLMPLYAAALFGKYEVVKYMYDNSSELCDVGWTPLNRGWLLEKCVENDMFGKYFSI